MKRIILTFWLGIFLCGSPASMSQQRQPKRIGGNFLASKLIYRVEPFYPEEALAAGLQGVVILVVTINERGEVADVRVSRGHPFFRQSAVDAVRQWRYAPTYLNGTAVPVTATVTVNYVISRRLVLDELGVLKDPESGVEGDALMEQLGESRGLVVVSPDAKAAFILVEEKLMTLQERGIRVAVTHSPYVFHDGRLFYSIPGPATEPVLGLDKEHLIKIARNSGRLPTAINLDTNGVTTLAYRLFLSETGEVLSLERLRGPEIPEIESELAHKQVITPALVGTTPVPAVVTVELLIPPAI